MSKEIKIKKEENMIIRLIASMLVITLTLANFLFIGKETYAIFESEDSDTSKSEVTISSNVEKYLKIEGTGTIVQLYAGLNKQSNSEETDNAEEKLIVDVPKIDEKLPEEVYIITPSEELGKDYTQEYQDGILTITIANSNYDRKDYKLICVYPEDVYLAEKEISWDAVAKANDEKIGENVFIEKLDASKLSDNITENINRDVIYTGIINNNDGDISTQYAENVEIEASYLENTNLKFEEKETTYEDGIKAETYYKTTTFSMNNLKRTLGEDFTVTVKHGNTETLINRNTETKEDSDEIIITYPENISQIEITTSNLESIQNPIMFKNQKELITNKSTKNLENIRKMETTYIFNETKKTFETYLKAPELETEIKLGENKTELTALEDNDVDIFITLLADEDKKDRYMLYDNPSFTVKMPENVNVKELKNVSIQAGGNLTVNKYELDDEGNIIIALNGKQEDYIKDNNNAQLQISAVLEVNKLINNTKGQIECEVSNQGKEEKYIKQLDLIGITTYSNLFTYLKVESFDNDNKIEIYKDGTDAKQIDFLVARGNTVNLELEAINNYNIDLKDINIKVNAKYTDKDGKESILDIMHNDSAYTEGKTDLDHLTQNRFNFSLELPNTLYYNEKIEIETDTTYAIDGQKTTIKQVATLFTQTKQKSSKEITSVDGKIRLETTAQLADGTILKDGDSVYAGETITYITTIVNNTDEDIKNVNVKATVENGNIYGLKGEERTNPPYYGDNEKHIEYVYAELDTNTVIFDTIENLGQEPITLKHEVVVSNKSGENIINKVELEAIDVEKIVEQNTHKIENAALKINIARKLTEIVEVYSTSVLDSRIKVENISDKDLTDVILKVYLKEGLTWEKNRKIHVYDENYNQELDIAEIKSYDENSKVLTIQINKLDKDEIININCEPLVDHIPVNKEKSEVSVYVVANEKYKSNLLRKEVLQSELGLSVTIASDVKENTKLKTGDEVTITAKIKNMGIMSDTISIEYQIPYALQLQETNTSDGGKIEVYNDKYAFYHPLIASEGEIDLQFKFKVDTVQTLNETCSNVIKVIHNYDTIKSNEITFQLDLDYEQGEGATDNPEDPSKPIEPDNPDEPSDKEDTYNISGLAWLDENGDGKRDEKEKLLSGIKVKLLDSNNKSEFVKDSNGKILEETTAENGCYKFENLKQGKYLVIFEYDTGKYELTDYQKAGIDENINSDAIVYSKDKNMGITKEINVKKDINNIDIGLRNLPKFDLELDKYISKITTQTNKGVKVKAYENTSFAKTEIRSKEISGATVIVEYTIKITNVGELAGKVTNIIDNMPSDMKFNSELNTAWYMDTDNKLNYTTLADEDIKPNESKEIKLILVKNMSTKNEGTTINTAEISKYSNSREIEDIDVNNNKASATVIITPATGNTTYIILITLLLGILGVGIYLIKKKTID